ncbi:MAG: DUF892 family protein [Phycisphaerales bacterium]
MRLKSEILGDQLRFLCNLTLDNQASLVTMASAAGSPTVRVELDRGVSLRAAHLRRLDWILEHDGWQALAAGCGYPGRLMGSGADAASRDSSRGRRDCMLTAWARQMLVEEIAACCSVQECAIAMGHQQATQLLGQTLREKHMAARRLVTVAGYLARRSRAPRPAELHTFDS